MPIRLLVERRSPDEGKIERGWRLTQVAWKLIRRDRTMLILAVTGVLSASVFSGLILYFGGYFSQSRSTSPGLALLTLVALYPSVLISVYFNVALAAAASAAFDGEQMMVQEALRIAWAKRARIAAWALISATVGALLSTIANRLPLGARLVAWLAGAAWGLATMFVIPILALEGGGAVDSLRKSGRFAKNRWGEEVTGNLAIGAWTIAVVIPFCVLLGAGAALSRGQPEAGLVLTTVALVGLFAISTLVAATKQVFAVALYRYAIDAPAGGFAASDLEYPFVADPARRRRKSWILRIGVPILILFFALGLIGVLLHRGAKTGAEGYWHLYFSKRQTTTIAIGSPVLADGRQIGSVVTLVDAGDSISIGFHIDTAYNSLVQTEPAFAVGARRHQYLCFGTRGECGAGSPSRPIPQLNPPT